MRTLAFDGRTGAAGDMLLAALLAAGADADALAPVTDALPVEYRIDRRDEHGVSATTVDVLLTDEGNRDDGSPSLDKAGGHGHSHDDEGDSHTHEHGDEDHTHEHDDDGHDHSHGPDGHTHGPDGHTHAEGHGVTRTYPEVVDIVESLQLGERAESIALGAFRRLGEAEATVHDTDLDSTAFHEVGADDAIADIVGVALLVADLNPEAVVTTPVFAGGGETAMAHGTYPVPAPAVVEIASEADWELRGGPVDEELLTPTGAAILAELAEGAESLPPMSVTDSGYGAGTLSLSDRPNVVRAVVGEAHSGLVRDEIRVLETNLDDASPELLGSLQRSLKEAGARDVSIVPVTMKKGRPGHLVKVIVRPPDVQAVARRLAEETGTLGVRETGAGHRWVATRAFETAELGVDGETYGVSVKVASDADGQVYDVSAEFDDADAVAETTGLSVREVIRRAEEQIR
ncbi:nickel pincer cofactor biosynthesis protein LarC [Halosegnis rubeus]|uniref:Putative nickel insertion protein n=1 Tax=Halosegnis rubeus TaxID=2212850 RepID=A0A5N5ULP9_9EURY|nr:nickel pincer cofactor biosynthesis protein LarC [Halosegnis rubeus]KAB7517046.1 nickel pincer cofactor biosynthesis protein LarC [Halosegnis rubeus]KAB7519826.1 nickel pincer cofactor biosynthesis protein LarC [Halosegnis rubeus]